MRAVVKVKAGSNGLEVRDVAEPRIGPEDALVRVRAAGVCGSDLGIYAGHYPQLSYPVTLGHELGGEVVGVGEAVTLFQVGDRVASEAVMSCGACYYCRTGMSNICRDWKMLGMHRDGCMADYVSIPARHLHKLPENLSYEEGAVAEPLAVAVHAALEVTRIRPNDTVAVLGTGPIGLLTVQAARSWGAGKIVVTGAGGDEERLEVAKKLGADLTVNVEDEDPVEKLMGLTDMLGVDVVFEASGSTVAVEQALRMARKGGQVTLVGIYHETAKLELSSGVVRKETTVKGTYSCTWSAVEKSLKLISSGKVQVNPLISHRLPLDRAEEGIKLALGKRALKVILIP